MARVRHWIPHIWGTEGIGWRTDLWTPADGVPSYGDVWAEENAGKTMGRPHSMMLGAGLYMETIGELEPGSVWQAYEFEEQMRPIWEKITAWCIERKGNVKILWNDADTQKNALLNEGVIVGQTWDGPPLALKSEGEPVMYQAPKEGSMAWVDGMSIPIGAKNIDQLYAFIDYAYQAEPAGKAIDKHGYNSPVLGADQFADAQYKQNFAEAYPERFLGEAEPLAGRTALVRRGAYRIQQQVRKRLRCDDPGPLMRSGVMSVFLAAQGNFTVASMQNSGLRCRHDLIEQRPEWSGHR